MTEKHGIAWCEEQLDTLIGLVSLAAGVRFLADGEQPDGARTLKQHRYCQALMRARRGGSVLLNAIGIACPAAAATLGANETVLGFPASMLPAIVEHLEYLAQKAMPATFLKKARTALQGQEPEQKDVDRWMQ